MLIGKSIEKIPATTAAENMANRLADRIRNIWLDNTAAGLTQWEEDFYEDPDGIVFLRGESFPKLIGIDYIFKWWGSDDHEGLAGELEVLWKVAGDPGVDLYKTWIRFGERDFIMGIKDAETERREWNRSEFRKAFAEWETYYREAVVEQ